MQNNEISFLHKLAKHSKVPDVASVAFADKGFCVHCGVVHSLLESPDTVAEYGFPVMTRHYAVGSELKCRGSYRPPQGFTAECPECCNAALVNDYSECYLAHFDDNGSLCAETGEAYRNSDEEEY